MAYAGQDIKIDVPDVTGNRGPNDLVVWLEGQPDTSKNVAADAIFNQLVSRESLSKLSSSKVRVRLCGFIEQCCKSKSAGVRDWALSKDLYLRLFDLYLEWNESDAERSLRLVLDLLVDLMTQGKARTDLAPVKLTVLDTLVSIMAKQSTKPLAKSAIMVLDRFLTKSVVSLEEVGTRYKACKESELAVTDIELWKSYLAEVFNWMEIQFVCPVAGKFVATVYRMLSIESKQGFLRASQVPFTVEIWHEWLLESLAAKPSLLDGIKNYIFVPLFKSEKKESVELLQRMNRLDKAITSPELDLDIPATLQLASLEVGKRVGLVEEPVYGGQVQNKDQTGPVVLQEDLLEHVLVHPSFSIRTHALSLIISSSSTTRPYSPTALVLLQKHLGMYFADSEARFRNELLGKLRDMYKRVRGGIFVLRRSLVRARAAALQKNTGVSTESRKPALYHTNVISHPEPELAAALELHEDFLYWYLRFLRAELVPTASYQRHVTSLKAVAKIIQLEAAPVKTWETKDDQQLFFDLFDSTWSRALLDLLMDPFDDVRDTAASVLRLLFNDGHYSSLLSPGTSPSGALSHFLTRANELANQTGRADHANGVARAYELLHRFSADKEAKATLLSDLIAALDKRIASAEHNLGLSVLDAPTHGLFAALSYIVISINEQKYEPETLTELDRLYFTMFECCRRIWNVVRDVLCDDSPEGHLPDDLDEMEGLDTKNLLSYSFRAVDESSKVMKAMIQGAKNYGGMDHQCPSMKVFSAIGNLSFEQLSTLRHRGALTTVSQTFAICCQMSRFYREEQASQPLLEQWYRATLNCIFTQRSTTRRSAGIPSMMIGILSANYQISFDGAMEELMKIGGTPAAVSEADGSNLPQVHALNSLTGIFKTSYLSHFERKLERYLPLCLQLAADCLRSQIWAIRNCGLLLLRGLMDNLFGTSESKTMMEAGWDGKANRLHYGRYPSLAPVLLSLLKSGRDMVYEISTTAAAEAVFPALDIIRRAGPPAALRDELQQYIADYLGSPAWHVREIAARTLCSCLLHDRWLESLRSILLLRDVKNSERAKNRTHGALLTAKFLVERLAEVMPAQLAADYDGLVTLLVEIQDNSPQDLRRLPDLQAAYLEVCNQASKYGLHLSRNGKEVTESLNKTITLSLAKPGDDVAEGESRGALFRIQRANQSVYALLNPANIEPFLQNAREMVDRDVSSLVATLETLPQVWPVEHLPRSTISKLFDLYLDICAAAQVPDVLATALQNFTNLMADTWKMPEVQPDKDLLLGLWSRLRQVLMNPSLSDEIVRASGVILGRLLSLGDESGWDKGAALRKFGLLVAESSTDDKPFDTRYAAAEALKLTLASSSTTNPSPDPNNDSYLPYYQALYNILNDDDSEIRDLGASALTATTTAPIIPMQAAANLLSSWRRGPAHNAELSAAAACRMVGADFPVDAPLSALGGLGSGSRRLREALKFDASLFLVEEQNLFVDEVRETKRWKEVFVGNLEGEKKKKEPGDAALDALAAWTRPGLKMLVEMAEGEEEDGPLGWTSRPAVFAVCARIVVSAVALVEVGGFGDVEGDLERLKEVGVRVGLSGLLLEMAGGVRQCV